MENIINNPGLQHLAEKVFWDLDNPRLIRNFGNSSKMANFGFLSPSLNIIIFTILKLLTLIASNCELNHPQKVNKIITCFGHHVSFVHKN